MKWLKKVFSFRKAIAKPESARLDNVGVLLGILDNLPTSIFVKDEQLRFVYSNAGHCDLIGKPESALFAGDLIPTRAHVPLPYIMGYDLFPVDTLEAKRSLLKEASERDWTLIFQHDVARRHAKIACHEGRYVAIVGDHG